MCLCILLHGVEQVLEQALWLLGNLAGEGTAARDAVLAVDPLPPLVRCLERHEVRGGVGYHPCVRTWYARENKQTNEKYTHAYDKTFVNCRVACGQVVKIISDRLFYVGVRAHISVFFL